MRSRHLTRSPVDRLGSSVRQIDEVRSVRKAAGEGRDFSKKLDDLLAQGELFGTTSKELQYLLYDLKLLWRCQERCGVCRGPHEMKIWDWEPLELARQKGSPAAKQKLEEITDLDRNPSIRSDSPATVLNARSS